MNEHMEHLTKVFMVLMHNELNKKKREMLIF